MDQAKMQGVEVPGDQRVPVTVRDWNAMKHAAWRNRVAWDIAERAAREILDRCRHAEGCPGADDDSAPCTGTPAFYTTPGEKTSVKKKPSSVPRLTVQTDACPDREIRMSTLVILNAARQFAPVDAKKIAEAPYFAPSREYYSAIVSDLGAAQAELEAIRGPTAKLPPSAEEKTA